MGEDIRLVQDEHRLTGTAKKFLWSTKQHRSKSGAPICMQVGRHMCLNRESNTTKLTEFLHPLLNMATQATAPRAFLVQVDVSPSAFEVSTQYHVGVFLTRFMSKMPAANLQCADCRCNPAVLEVRKRHLCQECFKKYISSKILKRMETYRFKNQSQTSSVNSSSKKRLLLPLSGGVSSLVLLEVLDRQIKKQLNQQGRTAYELVVCHVGTDLSVDEKWGSTEAGQKWYENTKQVFDLHTFLPTTPLYSISEHDSRIASDIELLGISRSVGQTDSEFLTTIITSTRTATSRTDLATLLLRRLLVAVAKQNLCDSIIWAHSDSTLAALTLASVAKGRGGGIPSDLCDGPSPWQELNFNYPLRDLFKTELEMYLGCLDDTLKACQAPERVEELPASLRQTSIDALMSTYITGQGEKYPSIMANVVRTVGKLQVPSAHESEEQLRCKLCSMPNIQSSSSDALLCYGCQRTKQDIKT